MKHFSLCIAAVAVLALLPVQVHAESHLVDSARDAVREAKDAVFDAAETVKERGKEGVASIKETVEETYDHVFHKSSEHEEEDVHDVPEEASEKIHEGTNHPAHTGNNQHDNSSTHARHSSDESSSKAGSDSKAVSDWNCRWSFKRRQCEPVEQCARQYRVSKRLTCTLVEARESYMHTFEGLHSSSIIVWHCLLHLSLPFHSFWMPRPLRAADSRAANLSSMWSKEASE